MATLAQIQTAVNARLATFWPAFRSKQTAYKAAKGRYWQGIVFSTVPDNGATVVPDFTKAPSDQYDYTPPVRDANGNITTPEVKTYYSWAFSGFSADLPSTVEAQMWCDTYEAPGGVHGYHLTCRVSKGGITYERVAWVEDGALKTTGSWVAL